MDKGTTSNLLSAALFVAGLALPSGAAREILLSVGLFAFSGGITNSLAVKMLFDRIPGLAGSGVIPARFREIRAKVKDLIMEHFFNEEYLRQYFSDYEREVDWQRYLRPSGGSRGPFAGIVEKQWRKLTAVEVVQPIIDEQVEKLLDSSVGGLVMMMGVETVKPAVNQFVTAFVASIESKVLEAAGEIGAGDLDIEIDEEKLVADVRRNVDALLEKKLEQLDAATVKRMMEDVIRSHLGWLVVWGNVLGGVLGLAAWVFQVS